MLTLLTPRRRRTAGPLPTMGLSDRAVARFRAYLTRHGRSAWKIFSCAQSDIEDIDEHLAALGDNVAWDRFDAVGEPEQWDVAYFNETTGPQTYTGGYLLLPGRQVAVARWLWTTSEHTCRLTLVAAPNVSRFDDLRTALDAARNVEGKPTWQIFAGTSYLTERLPRDPEAGRELLLSDAIEARIDTEIVGFFAPEVRGLYEAMNVPLRRGLLLYGPPGNGKTSLVRRLGTRLPNVRAILLRAGTEFGSDDLSAVIAEWKKQAPAMLVIEDLNWLLKSVNVSTFLNLLDGIERGSGEPLLLVATTNHPDQLDPAVNSRPGRFDVVIEGTNPDAGQRETYFRERLLEIDRPTIDLIVRQSEGLAFAHLEEVVRLSGLIAIKAARRHRTPDDVKAAVAVVRGGFDTAASGFARPLDVPFGLQHLRDVQRGA